MRVGLRNRAAMHLGLRAAMRFGLRDWAAMHLGLSRLSLLRAPTVTLLLGLLELRALGLLLRLLELRTLLLGLLELRALLLRLLGLRVLLLLLGLRVLLLLLRLLRLARASGLTLGPAGPASVRIVAAAVRIVGKGRGRCKPAADDGQTEPSRQRATGRVPLENAHRSLLEVGGTC
jgi:hypothetical protein